MNGPIPDGVRYKTESNWYLELFSPNGNKIKEHFLGTSKDSSGFVHGEADDNVRIVSCTDSVLLLQLSCRLLLYFITTDSMTWLNSITTCSGILSWDGQRLISFSGTSVEEYDLLTQDLLQSKTVQSGFSNIARGWNSYSNTYILWAWGNASIGVFSFDSGLTVTPLSERTCEEAFAFGDHKMALLMFSDPNRVDIVTWRGGDMLVESTLHISALNFPTDISFTITGSSMAYFRDNANDGKWEAVFREMATGKETVLWRNE
jgi:hypothetical protein